MLTVTFINDECNWKFSHRTFVKLRTILGDTVVLSNPDNSGLESVVHSTGY